MKIIFYTRYLSLAKNKTLASLNIIFFFSLINFITFVPNNSYAQKNESLAREYINQANFESLLVSGFLAEVEKRSFTQDDFLDRRFPLGTPNPDHKNSWLNPSNLSYIENVYASLQNNHLQVFIYFKNRPYIHSALSKSVVSFDALDSKGNYINRENISSALFFKWKCNPSPFNYKKTFANLSAKNNANTLNIASELAYPFNLCS